MHVCSNSTILNRRFGVAVLLCLLSSIVFAQKSETASSETLQKEEAAAVRPSKKPETVVQNTRFRIGEKLTYNISYGKFPSGGYAETFVASAGVLGGKQAVELRSRVKTNDIVSAAFLMFDESRTVYAAPDTGLPLYISCNAHEGPLPKETIHNFLKEPASSYDLLTLIFKSRETAGIGSFPFVEGDQSYTIVFAAGQSERIKTEAGEFDTTISTVQSDYLTANGIKELKINFDIGDFHVPVLFRIRTAKGEFRATLASIILPVVEAPTVTPTPTPAPTQTPKPNRTPEPYIDNRPLAPELGFQIGEVLDYQMFMDGRTVAKMSLRARERHEFPSRDTKEDRLLLSVGVAGAAPGADTAGLNGEATVQVDPETLAPRAYESKFPIAVFPGVNSSLTFDKNTGNIFFGSEKPIDSPIGTHTLLSLVYAMRSFNLKPSRDLNNPVNDTRVAVFWGNRPYVFTLRPSNPDTIVLNGEKVPAQLISINTGNKDLDELGLKVWLGTDDRVPLRFVFGRYQADLVSRSVSPPK